MDTRFLLSGVMVVFRFLLSGVMVVCDYYCSSLVCPPPVGAKKMQSNE
jgi:hypothetical protein